MSKKRKIILFLAASLISLSLLLGYGKEVRGAYITTEDCSWIFACDLYVCLSGDRLCSVCGFDDWSGCSRSGCGGQGSMHSRVYQNSCTGSQVCNNGALPPPGTKSTCYYIGSWYCSGGTAYANWNSVNGTSCSDAAQISCCASGYGNYCISSANSCGQTGGGSIQCNGSCSATTPANPSGYGNACTSAANVCGQTNTGTIGCSGCTAVKPSDSGCSFTLTVNKAGTGSGTVTGAGTYNYNTTVTATAAPSANSTFTGWSGDCNSGGQVTMTSAKTCTATFTLIPPPAVDVKIKGADGVDADGSVFTNYNTPATISWTVSGNVASCTASGGWSGAKSVSGGSYATPGNITANTTFSLSCAGAGGTTADSGTAAMVPPPTNPSTAYVPGATTATISWTPASGYNIFYLRTQPVGGAIYYNNDYAPSSYTFNVVPGQSYAWWVHSKAPNGAYSQEIGQTFNCNSLPTASGLTAPNWSIAQASTNPLRANLQFSLVDPDAGSYGSAYQVIVKKADNTAVLDTGVCTGYATPSVKCKVDPVNCLKNGSAGCLNLSDCACTYTLDVALLNYNQGYKWSIQIWDNNNTASPLTWYSTNPDTDNDDGVIQTFTTYKHKMPLTSFTHLPTAPSKGEQVKFTSTSKIYLTSAPTTAVNCTPGQCTYLWTATAGATIDDTAASTPTITFNSTGNSTVTLKVTDNDGYNTSTSDVINVNAGLPGWKEVKPE